MKTYKCPACQNEVDSGATVCSNPACRAKLAVCPHCRDITTYTLAEKRSGLLMRDLYRCDRCQNFGLQCYTWLSGGYCNGLARPGKRFGRPLCPSCSGKASEVTRSILSWTVIGAVGGIIRKK